VPLNCAFCDMTFALIIPGKTLMCELDWRLPYKCMWMLVVSLTFDEVAHDSLEEHVVRVM
jgi:hypothetical protein